MRNKLLIRLLILCATSQGLLKAQQSIVPAGTLATGSGGSSSYTIGQIDYLQKGSGTEVMEGVQQAYEIISLDVKNLDTKEKDILLYPNPVKDFLSIDFRENSYQNSDYLLFDLQGQKIRQGTLNQQKSKLDFSLLSPSVYILRILQNNQVIKTFKIIKK